MTIHTTLNMFHLIWPNLEGCSLAFDLIVDLPIAYHLEHRLQRLLQSQLKMYICLCNTELNMNLTGFSSMPEKWRGISISDPVYSFLIWFLSAYPELCLAKAAYAAALAVLVPVWCSWSSLRSLQCRSKVCVGLVPWWAMLKWSPPLPQKGKA